MRVTFQRRPLCDVLYQGIFFVFQEFVTVREKSRLISKILDIIGQRLAEFLFESQDPSETARMLSGLPMSVTTWLRKQVYVLIYILELKREGGIYEEIFWHSLLTLNDLIFSFKVFIRDKYVGKSNKTNSKIN